MEKDKKEKTTKVRYLNVVIYPEKRQSPQRYCELLTKISDANVAVNTYSEKITQIENLDLEQDVYHGKLVNFTDLHGKKWFDKDKNVVEDFQFDLNKFPNAKEKEFYFFPNMHRIAVISNDAPSLGQVQKFFQYAFNKVASKKDDESVEVNIISESVIIDKIFSAKSLTSLEIHVSYSNNDLNEGYQAYIDETLKQDKVRKVDAKFTATQKNPMSLSKNGVVGGLLSLSQNNGYAVASGEIDGLKQTVSTQNYPKVSTIKYIEGEILAALKPIIEKIVGKRNHE